MIPIYINKYHDNNSQVNETISPTLYLVLILTITSNRSLHVAKFRQYGAGNEVRILYSVVIDLCRQAYLPHKVPKVFV